MGAVLVSLVLASPIRAAEALLTGPARTIDGDTLDIGGAHVRLKGIATPERGEPGFRETKEAMKRLIGSQTVACELTGERTHDRAVGYCSAGSTDLQAEMVRLGYAKACPRFTTRYVSLETEGKAVQGPVWKMGYSLPGYCRIKGVRSK